MWSDRVSNPGPLIYESAILNGFIVRTGKQAETEVVPLCRNGGERYVYAPIHHEECNLVTCNGVSDA